MIGERHRVGIRSKCSRETATERKKFVKKMPCLFVREFHGQNLHTITDRITPGCEWVLAGEGVATVKWDGTACLVRGGALWKRYDAKVDPKTGVRKVPPPGALPCDPEPDPATGHWPHWVRVDPDKPEDKRHAEAWDSESASSDDGTYELVGPAVNANPHLMSFHTLVKHGARRVAAPDLSFEGLRALLADFFYEGVVFHHPDGRMCKIRRADFGFAWPLRPRVFPLGLASRPLRCRPLVLPGEPEWSSREWRMWEQGCVSEGRAVSVYHYVTVPCGKLVRLDVDSAEKWDVTFADTPRAAWEPGRVMRVDARRRAGTGAGVFYCTVWAEEASTNA